MTGTFYEAEPVPPILEERALFKYEALHASVMAKTEAIRASMAEKGISTLSIPISETVTAAATGFDEIFGTPFNTSYTPEQIGGYGLELRLMDWNDQWGHPRIETKQYGLEQRPLGIYYTFLDTGMEPIANQNFRFGLLPEKKTIDTASSYFTWGSPYYKPRVDVEDLAYINLLLTEAQTPKHRPTPASVSVGGLRKILSWLDGTKKRK